MEEAPDGSGRCAIAEQDGRVVLARKGTDGAEAREFLNLEERKPHVSLEQGLLSLAFHPRFGSNGLFYIFYSQQNPRRTVLSEMKVSAGNPDRADTNSERILLEIPQPSEVHKAGQASFGPDGFLYLGVGDGGGQNDEFGAAQNTATVRGKILRIDVNTRSSIGLRGRARDAALRFAAGQSVHPRAGFLGEQRAEGDLGLWVPQSVALQLGPRHGGNVGGRCRPGQMGGDG